MSRATLDETHIHPAVRAFVAGHHAATVQQVQGAVLHHPVVVVGMAHNPWVGKARRALDAAGVAHLDINYGSYFSAWRQRNALKMWSGWPTFPMVFVKGQLVGGAAELQRLIGSGELKRLLG